ncbi:ABC transporter ATP-binding protein [Gryllotalpicola protaetiae]|uniref:ABC transporter ATP-binding protein n=1 Tax=Gryllotalpicola protaetiae TaxID=2419771 RepID=A0A387BTT1_9MICO|nr:ABC transporter ATP-binding protein [Gryllotalpicola protaetiae]AYG04347.1 ABC transporter ATP-binding protein [Gryllotalpicola protaetiae]
MTSVIEVSDLTKRFGSMTALDSISLTIPTDSITGLLGRNGAGKTTLMHVLTGQDFPTSGDARVFGKTPAENASVLQHIAFIKESQKYPDDFKPSHVFRSAPWFFENWDADFAAQLVEDFRLPTNRRIKKLSRGQLSAVGVIVGLASRAPLTFFDEPYLGLDAVARQIFYDRLLADYAEFPRTIVLSTHLIDEVANLLEHVVVIDQGRIILDAPAEELRGRAASIVGAKADIDAFVSRRRLDVLHRDELGSTASMLVDGVDEVVRLDALNSGLQLTPVSLQQLIVRRTGGALAQATDAGAPVAAAKDGVSRRARQGASR